MDIDGVEYGSQSKNPIIEEGEEAKQGLEKKDESDEIPRELIELLEQPIVNKDVSLVPLTHYPSIDCLVPQTLQASPFQPQFQLKLIYKIDIRT